ncbi:hypothetical protein [Elizabethkingia meningoseptica]|uniref:hypothetical protein n=1 Tax=Elizabethkingia meningoseptica TaxID=238 RepID=UPI002011BBB2|nr:hypothetical protein [Elizabethkingia meningoseptica]MCL1676507.1 hypothetical protein [Elizabethkingia meningoseptica]MCL1687429.1 hypothetical protein [Elizabethkingia meningoseptica]
MKARINNTINEQDYLSVPQVLSDQDKAEIDFDFYLDELETFFMEDFNADLYDSKENAGTEEYLKEK